MVKAARCVATAVLVRCPHGQCWEPVPSPSGSHLWARDELTAAGVTMTCHRCRGEFKLTRPASVLLIDV